MDRIAYCSYTGLIEPLGQSQVVPYLVGLARTYALTVISFEKPVWYSPLDALETRCMQDTLQTHGIRWVRLTYHQRPSLPATCWDILTGVWALWNAGPFRLVHARGYVPGAIARIYKLLTWTPMLFDLRGLQAEEYRDAGHWTESSLIYRLTKWMEARILATTDGLVTLSDAIGPTIMRLPGMRRRWPLPAWRMIPTCVDLQRFQFDPEARGRLRRDLGVGDRPVLVYAGSVGSWYRLDEMVRCYDEMRASWPGLFLLLLINGDADLVRALVAGVGIGRGNCAVRGVSSSEMPGYLSAADVGMALITACPSKVSSCPTKYGEYLACGLPVLANAGIGDVATLLEGVGVVLTECSPATYRQAVPALQRLVDLPRGLTRARAVERLSLQGVGIPAYQRLYREILA